MLEVVQRLPIEPIVGGSRASSCVGGPDSILPRTRDVNQGSKNDIPSLMAPQDVPPARQQLRVII